MKEDVLKRVEQVSFNSLTADKDQIEQLIKELLVEHITENTEIPDRQVLIKLGGVPVAYRGDVVAVKGAEKVGKSQFAAVLMAAVLNDCLPSISVTEGCKMLLIDTEQSARSVKIRLLRALRTAKTETCRTERGEVFVISVRRNSIEERTKAVQTLAERLNPDIIYIDGVVQFLNDFNDIEESQKAVQTLKNLTARTDGSERLVIGVVHTNPTGDDGAKMRGHLGTLLAQTAQSVIMLSKKNGKFLAKTVCNRDDADTETVFEIDNERGIFTGANDPLVDEMRDVLKQAFSLLKQKKEPASRKALHDVLISVNNPQTGKPYNSDKAYKIIKDAMAIGVAEYKNGLIFLR